MSFSVRRSTALVAAARMALAVAAEPVFAQATVGPAGGVGSTTAPSNSQGTPAGGTGVISTTRVGPSGAVTAAPPVNTAPVVGTTSAAPTHPRRVRHRARRAPRPATQIGTQSQAGTNGSAVPSK